MEKVLIIETEGNKFYNVYNDGKSNYLEIDSNLIKIIGSATDRFHPKEIYLLEPEGRKMYKFFSDQIVIGEFLILEKPAYIHRLKRIKNVIREERKST